MKVSDPVCGTIEVRGDGPGWAAFWPYWASGVWEPYTLAWLQRLGLPGRVFVDVGAWIGPISFWAHALGAKVIAIEPDPVAFDALWDNIEENGFWGITACSCAVTNERGSTFLTNKMEFGNSSSSISKDSNDLCIPCDTLPSILQYLGVEPSEVAGVIVDIEGYEQTLMPALGPWLEEHDIPYRVESHA